MTYFSVVLVVVAGRGQISAHPVVGGQSNRNVSVGLADHLEEKFVARKLV
jgi:hypothetical protein